MKEICTPAKSAKNKTNEKKWNIALYFFGIGGISVGMSGLVLCGIAFLGFVENAKQINRFGTWLIVLAFPLMMFSAHALDKLSEFNR